MSLTSRVAKLFSGSSTAPDQPNSNHRALENDGSPNERDTFADPFPTVRSSSTNTMPQEEFAEERPPYLHVRAGLQEAQMERDGIF